MLLLEYWEVTGEWWWKWKYGDANYREADEWYERHVTKEGKVI